MKHLSKYYLIFTFFFLLDKILLVPELRFSWTVSTPVNPYVDSLDNKEYPYKDKKDMRIVWNYGTSRSGCFYRVPVPAQTAVDPYLSQEDRSRINRYEINNFSSRGSDPEIYLTRMLQLLERGIKPDAVFIEISPLSFNENNQFSNFAKTEGISFFTLIGNLDKYSINTIREIVISRLFTSYRYKLSWDKIAKSKNDSSLFMTVMNMRMNKHTAGQKTNQKLTDQKLNDYQSGNMTERDYLTKFKLVAKIIEQPLLGNWKLDSSRMEAVDTMIRIAEENGIPVVIWRPDVHPLMKEMYVQKNVHRDFEPALQKIIQERKVPYIDFNSQNLLKCNYFTDVSHLSARCCSEMAARLTEALEKR
ncbi:MAG: DUF1574 domain-containing protein [Spirochaetia bacterium]|nr:DUF1574 domain-containing protein [Spirochaetia bacterium]